jgi:hypothetical protein
MDTVKLIRVSLHGKVENHEDVWVAWKYRSAQF